MKMTLSFYQHMDDTGIENVLRNMRMCANGLLITSCQFILVKMKVNAFISVGKKPVGA